MKTPYYNVPNLQKIADLEAEVERLKGVIESQNRSIDRHLTLITELCDAMKDWEAAKHWGWTQELLQRAKDATTQK